MAHGDWTNGPDIQRSVNVTVDAMSATVNPSAIEETTVILDEGPVTVRLIRADDAAALTRFHHRLSDTSIRRRYFWRHHDLRAEEVAHLTQVDGMNRVALVVERTGELVAVGRYDRLDDPTQAEVSFVVADAFQHHGLATMLLHRLAVLAQGVGATHLRAEVLAENRAMLTLFHAAGFPIESECSWGTVDLKVAIVPSAGTPRAAQTGTTQSNLVPLPSMA
jgi:RimJ/RimL family protein N-acetyltransferase